MSSLSKSYLAKIYKDGVSFYEEINCNLDDVAMRLLSTIFPLCGEQQANIFQALLEFWTTDDGEFVWTNDEVDGLKEGTYKIIVQECLAKRLKSDDNECQIIQGPWGK